MNKHEAERVTGDAVYNLPAGTKAVIVSVSNDNVVNYIGHLIIMANTPEGDQQFVSLTGGGSWAPIQVALNFELVILK